jgi:release factor glutamine methyltransferase
MGCRHEKIFYGGYEFLVFEQVYKPSEDTFLLARNLSVTSGERVLDMGTGSGILAILAAQKARRVVAVDINPHALACTRRNAELNGVTSKVEVRLGDLFTPLKPSDKFELILFNPPYLPVGEGEGKSWIEQSWAGGKTGRAVINRFTADASNWLMEKGRVLMVQSTLSNVEETLKQFQERKLNTNIIDRTMSFFEEITLIQAEKRVG